MKGKQASAFKNESIPVSAYTQLRVVYKDKDTGVSKWELLRKVDAIALARKMGLDLLLVVQYTYIHTYIPVHAHSTQYLHTVHTYSTYTQYLHTNRTPTETRLCASWTISDK